MTGVGVKDLILPGDMRELLQRDREAENIAQANVIKRREETAVARSRLNMVKLIDESRTLLRFEEHQALESVAGNVERPTVFGDLDRFARTPCTSEPSPSSDVYPHARTLE